MYTCANINIYVQYRLASRRQIGVQSCVLCIGGFAGKCWASNHAFKAGKYAKYFTCHVAFSQAVGGGGSLPVVAASAFRKAAADIALLARFLLSLLVLYLPPAMIIPAACTLDYSSVHAMFTYKAASRPPVSLPPARAHIYAVCTPCN
jgi:hypothetical protein